MNIANDWVTILTIVGAGVVTLAIRVSFQILPATWVVPSWFTRALKYVAVAVLPALVLPDVLFRDVPPSELVNASRLIAAAVAMLVAWKTRHIFITVVAGMAVLWGLRFLG